MRTPKCLLGALLVHTMGFGDLKEGCVGQLIETFVIHHGVFLGWHWLSLRRSLWRHDQTMGCKELKYQEKRINEIKSLSFDEFVPGLQGFDAIEKY